MRRRNSTTLLACVLLLLGAAPMAHQAWAASERKAPWRLSLNGAWKFHLLGENRSGPEPPFHEPEFDDADWAPIETPSNWEMAGFETPQYKEPRDTVGLYRRAFHVPESFEGRRSFLVFHGVLFGFDCWVNGQWVGSYASAYTTSEFEITPHLRPGENILAVRVSKRKPGWKFDCNDAWALSGIYRDVALVSRPNTYIDGLWTVNRLGPPASVLLQGKIHRADPDTPEHGIVLRGALRSPGGRVLHEIEQGLPLASTSLLHHFQLPEAQAWTAESPALYRLILELKQDDRVIQHEELPLGFRDIEIDGVRFLLNGAPVSLRGVNRHAIWPEVGRALEPAHWRQDLERMQGAHINMVRTAHYPPHPGFLDLCDSMGMYVICEVPFGYGDSHLEDPAFQEHLFQRARDTVRRLRQHPSIILWSVGNENPYTPLVDSTVRMVKALDHTRPVCIPQSPNDFRGGGLSLPPHVDVLAPHYPTPGELRRYAALAKRPIVATEYCHALGYAFEGLGPLWETMWELPGVAGGAIWHWADQGLARTAAPGEMGRALHDGAEGKVFTGPETVLDSAGDRGSDGIVYANRTAQPDYWRTQKVYAPIHIAARQMLIPDFGRIEVELENRLDFTTVSGALDWRILANGQAIAQGREACSLEPHARRTLDLNWRPMRVRDPVAYWLEARFRDGGGRALGNQTMRLEPGHEAPPGFAEAFPLVKAHAPVETRIKTTPEGRVTAYEARHRAYRLYCERGQIYLRAGLDLPGQLLIQGIHIRLGRRPSMAEARIGKKKYPEGEAHWMPPLAMDPEGMTVTVDETTTPPTLRLEGAVSKDGAPSQSVRARIAFRPDPGGFIAVDYSLEPRQAKGVFLEAGLSLELPPEFGDVRWLGGGPFPGYPGAMELAPFGVHRLKLDDLWFDGNRPGVEIAVCTDSWGKGLAMLTSAANVAWEKAPPGRAGLILSHNAVVGGRGAKVTKSEYEVRVEDVPVLQGSFKLVPLIDAVWPRPLGAVLGDAVYAAEAAGPPYPLTYDHARTGFGAGGGGGIQPRTRRTSPKNPR